MGLASAPCILFLVDVDVVVAVVSPITPTVFVTLVITAAVDFLDTAFVVVVFLLASGPCNLSIFFSTLNKLICGLCHAFANNDRLRNLLPDDDGLHLHLHGLRGFIADVDGLGWCLGLGLGAEVLGRSGVLLELIRLVFPWEDFPIALVVSRDADLSAGWRRVALVLALVFTVDAVLRALRRWRALGVTVVPLFAHRLRVSLDDVLLD